LTSVQSTFGESSPENERFDAAEMYNFIVELEDEDFCMPRAVCEVAAKSRTSAGTRNEIEKRAMKYIR
jgi:hypothetical protein